MFISEPIHIHFLFYTEFLSANRQGLSVLVALLLGLFFLSFITGGSKTAFLALKQKDVNLFKHKSDENAKRIVRLLDQPALLVQLLQIAHLILNSGIVVLLNYIIDALLGFQHAIPFLEITIKIIIITTIVLLLCEMIPRVWAHHHTLSFISFASWWLEKIVVPIFKPAVLRIQSITHKIEKKGNKNMAEASADEELVNAIDRMTEEEASAEEKQILKGIQKFSNITVRQVMRSRLDVSGIEWNASFMAIIEQITDQNYSRYPVYESNLDEIKGILQTKDLLSHLDENDDFNWRQFIHPALFVPEQKLIEDLLKEFQTKRIHIAIVVDEFGGTSGLVTLEDILEEIIGEIKDEFDEDESMNKKLDDHNYQFEGKTMIHEVCKMMDIPMDTFDQLKGESESLAGLVLEIAERLPKINDIIESDGFSFTVLDIGENRIKKVKVTISSQ
ncbi:MAG: gliding motility-associated protein GldE [Bacteroidota bacterium]